MAAGALLLTGSAPATAGTSAATGPDQHPHPSDRTVTVATFNIHHAADADDVLDLERIARDIASFEARVIGLQEVDRHWGDRSDFQDQAAELAELLDMHHCYGANLDEDPAEGRTERRQYGTAILSEYPPSGCRNSPLPNLEGGEQRGLLAADVSVRGSQFTFYTTHLTHVGDAGEYRIQQFEAVNEIVASSGRPGVLVGDLNATPDTAEYGTFTTVFQDVWTAVGEGEGFTFPPQDADRRIDYVMATGQITPLGAEVPQVLSSDHLPVVAELRLPHPSEQRPRG